jgi:ketosteroid isomerase-like protein
MSQENVEIVRRATEAFNQRDLDALFEQTSPDFEFIPYLTTLIETTTYRGRDAFHRYFEDADAAWKQIHARLDDVREVGEGLIYASGEIHGEGRASGLEVQLPLFWLCAVHNGKLTRVQTYESAAAALRAAGVSE